MSPYTQVNLNNITQRFKKENRSKNKTSQLAAYLCLLALFGLANFANALTCTTSADSWGSGYVLNVTVTNNSNSSISGWEVKLSHSEAPGITGSWNANVSSSGNRVTASNVSWNGSLSAGQSTSFGYQGTHSGNFSEPNCTGDGGTTTTPVPTTVPTPAITPTVNPTNVPTPTGTPGPTNEPTPTPSQGANLVLQESQEGFCKVEGTVDSNNAGFTGGGFANTDNATGKGIEWSLEVESGGNYELEWRFANGSSTNRSASIIINGTEQAATDFNGTGSWSSWRDTETITVYLSAGYNTLRLNASTSSGLANIDKMTITGTGVKPGNCMGGPTPVPTPTPEPTPTQQPTPTPIPTATPTGDIVITADKPTIWYASDSTVRHYNPNRKNQQGVGQRLPEFLTNDVSIANYAKGGRAVNSFISDGFWGQILNGAQAGDVILIQFGINDRGDVPNKNVFKEYLRRYVREARAIGAIPVFVTPTPRNQHRNGVFTNAFTKYCDAKFEVGAELNVTVIDLQTKGRDFYTQIGPSRVSREMMVDTLHLAIMGAYHMARLLAEGISESNLYPLREKVIQQNLDPNRTPTVDGWTPRSGYSYN